jgi:phosphoribosyl 1,2-cyclic phosphodiesterase
MRSIWIKLISFLIIAATMISTLAACSSNEDTGESDSESNGGTGGVAQTEPIVDPEGVITIFANGAYNARVIRPENATDDEKNVYNQIRALLKKRTGENPSINTDFVAANTERYEGPAILIGETDYDESKAAYRKLGVGEASATLSGNKFVLAFSTPDSVKNLIELFKTNLNKKASKTEIKINSDWEKNIKLQYYTSGNETFDENGLKSSATVPGNLGTQYDAGQNSKTYVKTGATKSTFDEACAAVEANGFKKYTTNKIGNNEFATYITQTQILHFMYFPNKGELRTAVDKRGTGTKGFTLPGLSGDNSYPALTNSLMTLVEIENSSWPGGMCLIFKLCDGRFVIVDSGVGGRDNDGSSSGWVYATLAKHAEDPKNIQVAAWIITHIHSDHAGGLVDMARGTYEVSRPSEGQNRTHNVMPREIKQYIKIDTLIFNRPANNVDGRNGWMDEIIKAFKVKNVIKAHPGQVFYYANCKVTMYSSLDLVIDKKISNHNDESLAMMFEFNGKKFLVLGDVYPQNTAALAKIYKESLKADIVQTSHHGYDNTDAAQVYEYVQATMVIWPVASYEMKDCDLKNANVNAIFKDNVPENMQFAPHGGNIDFDENWKASKTYRVYNAIPYCDCSWCKTQPNTNKSKSSNF